MQTKDFKLELKTIGSDGTFEGYLSVYGVVDLGNDVVLKGAFTKTIQEQKGVVPMLWNHKTDTPIGVLHLADDDYGLKVQGEMFIAESPKAAEMHGMAKRFQELGRPMGLSIGFDTVKKALVAGVRQLKEVKLFEGSMTLFPMLPLAQLTGIKSAEQKDDFLTELDQIQTFALRYMMLEALYSSLCDAVYDQALSADEKVQASSDSIDQFKTAYLDFLPKLLVLMGGPEAGPMGIMSAKAGRRHSAADRTVIEEAIVRLQALLAEEEGTSAEAAIPKTAAATQSVEPDYHSLLAVLDKFSLKGQSEWN